MKLIRDQLLGRKWFLGPWVGFQALNSYSLTSSRYSACSLGNCFMTIPVLGQQTETQKVTAESRSR